MPRLTRSTPAYKLHKASGQARVCASGWEIFLGQFGSPRSRAEYDRIISEWLANGRRFPNTNAEQAQTDFRVSELILEYLKHAKDYYRKDGRPSKEFESIKHALKPLRKVYGHTQARDFGPLALKTVRQTWIDDGLTRGEINKRTGRIVRCFKWAFENELVPPAILQALKAVAGLRKGRSAAPEGKPVRPVADDQVEAVRPLVDRRVWAMIELQRLIG